MMMMINMWIYNCVDALHRKTHLIAAYGPFFLLLLCTVDTLVLKFRNFEIYNI
jgi:hypothetical protein